MQPGEFRERDEAIQYIGAALGDVANIDLDLRIVAKACAECFRDPTDRRTTLRTRLPGMTS